MGEGFFYSFAFYLFSVTNVFPDYVSRMTDDPVVLSLLSVLYYGPVYLASIVSCWLSLNAPATPKRLGLTICYSQRVGLILIALSSLMIGKAPVSVCLVCFFVAFLFFNIADGISAPLYYNMASSMIYRNIGTFFGAYNMVGSVSGVFASLLLTYLYSVKPYPGNYQLMFGIGVLFALASSFMVAFGTKEYPGAKAEKVGVTWKELPQMMMKCISENRKFRNYTIIYVILGAADFAMPLYSIRLAQQENLPANFIGIMSLISLVSGVAANWIWGRLSDRKGPFFVLVLSTICGICAAVLTILNPGGLWNYAAYSLIAFASCGSSLTNNIACTIYAEDGNSTLLTSTSKLCAAPICILASIGSGVLAQWTSLKVVFAIALCAYTICLVLSTLNVRKRVE
ncbi:MAG: MFS transporter [Oscillospiraceae bacterium]|nr:MFS transporter [Oscillospiraceae bacterium]